MSHNRGWALRLPNGDLNIDTARRSKDDCWIESFALICAMVPDFHQAYWKKWDASIVAAKKIGFSVVRIELKALKRSEP